MPVAPPLGYIGVAKETVKGTPVTATAFPIIRQNRILKDEITQLDDDGMRGSMIDGPYDQVAGPQWATFEGGAPMYADTLAWWLLGILGDVSFSASRTVADGVTASNTTLTSATAAFTQQDIGKAITPSADFAAGTVIISVQSATSVTLNKAALTSGTTKTITLAPATVNGHSGSVKNTADGQPTSLTLTDFYGLTGGTPARQSAGLQIEEVGLKFTGAGLYEYTLKAQGFGTVQVAKPTLTVSSVTPSPGWEIQAVLAGTLSPVLVDGELTIKRPTEAIHVADGTAAPYRIWQGGLNVAGKMTFVAEDDSEYQRYLNHTTPSIALIAQHGSGAATIGATIVMSKCNVKHSQPKHDGIYMQWEDELQALWNATDAGASGGLSPLRANFMTPAASGTYQ